MNNLIKLPMAFWGFCYILISASLAGYSLHFAANNTAITGVVMAVVSLAASISTGSFGVIVGHAIGVNSKDKPPADPTPAEPQS